MSEKLAFRLLLICIQGGIEERLKIVVRGRIGVSLGHYTC